MNTHLLLHTVLYSFDVAWILFLIILVFLKAKPGASRTIFILLFLCVSTFVLSHLVGVTITNPELARRVFMFNLVDTILPVLTVHCVFAFFGKNIEKRKIIVSLYVAAAAIIGFFITFPQMFLATPVSKLYFQNYYQPGPYYWVMLVFFFSVTIYFLISMIRMYRVANGADRNRLVYFFIGLVCGYTFGPIDFLLIYNIPADPLWGFLFIPFFTIPFTYAAIKYELMNVRLVAKHAFTYTLVTAVIGVLLALLNYLNTFIIQNFPDFPVWVSSLVLALLASAAALFIWRKARESDILKYEFVTIVTHKFRTPLTYIRWSAENLIKAVPPELVGDVHTIQAANSRLVEFTNLLAHLSDTDTLSTDYHFSPVHIEQTIGEIIEGTKESARAKNIDVAYSYPTVGLVMADEQRMRFVFQTLFDNAVSYTPQGGGQSVDFCYTKK